MQILIVDDTQSELLVLKAILDNMGLKIVAVDSGSKALSCLLFQDFVAVLLDVDMPLMDGFETATLLRKQTRNLHLPIIFIVSEPILDSERIKGYQLGAVDYILTPIIPEILRSKVAVFCDLYRLQKQELVISQNLQDKNTLIEQQNLKLLGKRPARPSIPSFSPVILHLPMHQETATIHQYDYSAKPAVFLKYLLARPQGLIHSVSRCPASFE